MKWRRQNLIVGKRKATREKMESWSDTEKKMRTIRPRKKWEPGGKVKEGYARRAYIKT